MKYGYSSHSTWTPLIEIKKLEVEERGNAWFDDSGLDLKKTKAIWITRTPREAAAYLVPADFHEEFLFNKRPNKKTNYMSDEDWKAILDIYDNPDNYVYKIVITGCYAVLDDGDHGMLYIKPEYRSIVNPAILYKLYIGKPPYHYYTGLSIGLTPEEIENPKQVLEKVYPLVKYGARLFESVKQYLKISKNVDEFVISIGDKAIAYLKKDEK